MDQIKVGKFIAELRKEKNLTQAGAPPETVCAGIALARPERFEP